MKQNLREFLREDIGSGDITTELVIPSALEARGKIICKEDCVLAGLAESSDIFKELGARVVKCKEDGTRAEKGDVVLEVKGRARALLAGERLALNMVMRMSGIATLTDAMVRKCRKINPNVRVAATRKTTPGFREFEKKAIMLGGGDPHRMGLYDAVLIKNNHIAIAGGVAEALARARRGSFTKKIEIEVDTEKEAHTALANGADIIMLDNFDANDARRLILELKAKRPGILIEVSGGINPDNIDKYAPEADIISLGALTNSVRSVDFSMKIEKI